MPKFNMYQSLHTTVIGPQGKPVEMQIRTTPCTAARSTASRRTGSTRRTAAPASTPTALGDLDDMNWVRQLLDWQSEVEDPGEFLESLRFEINRAEVFVFTPRGDVIALPVGVDAGRLRVRRAHRGRAPHHRRPGQRPARAAGVDARQRRRGRDLHLQGADAPARRATGSTSSSRRGPAPRSSSGSPRSGARRRSSRARSRSPS